MYPKYDVILTKIKSEFLQMAMYTDFSEERAILEKAFPECYSEDPNDLRVPASLLRHEAKKDPETMSRLEPDMWWNTEYFGIPTAFYWADYEPNKGQIVPEEVLAQIVNTPIRGGFVIRYMGEQFIVTRLLVDGSDKLGDMITQGNIVVMCVVHARFIDLNS